MKQFKSVIHKDKHGLYVLLPKECVRRYKFKAGQEVEMRGKSRAEQIHVTLSDSAMEEIKD